MVSLPHTVSEQPAVHKDLQAEKFMARWKGKMWKVRLCADNP